MSSDGSTEHFREPDPFEEQEASAYRALRVYAFGPLRGRRGGNHLMLKVPFEELHPGPIGSRIAVVDEDLEGNQLFVPVDLEHPDVRIGGFEPNDSNPQFHQQMVYAVISNLLRTFDRALGHKARFRAAGTAAPTRLTVRPHAITEVNAYYDPEKVALSFGRIEKSRGSTGLIIPRKPVYICLFHDVVLHETAHALLDGLRPLYMVPTSVDSYAFHEGFCDLVALLQQLTFEEPLADVIQRTGGRLYSVSLQPELRGAAGDGTSDRNPLLSLGQQFGEALGSGEGPLRSAIGTLPDKAALENEREPHQRGAIMMNAVFDAFFRVYVRRTRGLFRLSAWMPPLEGDLHPDLTRRLAAEASQLATTLLHLCIRAIAYCPAVDIAMGDFLRAMMTVHVRLDPDDRDGLRDALIDAFARRGIYPPDVESMSESALTWRRHPGSLVLARDVVRALRAADVAGKRDRAAEKMLKIFCEVHRRELGFVPDVPLQMSPFHQSIRFVGPELDVAEELVCLVTQTVNVKGSGKVYGGTTLIFGDDGRDGRLRYAITKRIDAKRQRAQLAWQKPT